MARRSMDAVAWVLVKLFLLVCTVALVDTVRGDENDAASPAKSAATRRYSIFTIVLCIGPIVCLLDTSICSVLAVSDRAAVARNSEILDIPIFLARALRQCLLLSPA